MSGLIDESVIADILNRTNIAEVIAEYIPLKKAGRNFKALCPFHHEKTPSLMISTDKQIYHCFGCGAGGNAINFLMQYERLEFPEAVALLARKCGVRLPEKKQGAAGRGIITQLSRVNEIAAGFYAQTLLKSSEAKKARTYCASRGITSATAQLFHLGFAPERWDGLISHCKGHSVPLSVLEKAGLAIARENGGHYDRFRNRIIFPIFDLKSSVIGFGARVLDNSLPKYINSPETPVYSKGKNLFGLNVAKDAIRQSDCAVIVEGYLDCIIPYQAGIQNIVASLGTAFTPEQARILKRFTRNVVVVYDPDSAGQMAALRSLDIFIEEDMYVRVAVLPKGYDPDAFVRGKGAQEFRGLIADAVDFFDYAVSVLKQKHDIKTAVGKSALSEQILPMIRKVPNAVARSEYIRRLAEQLQVKEEDVRDELAKLRHERLSAHADTQTAGAKHINVHPTEQLLIKLMLEENRLIDELRNRISPSDFLGEKASKIVSMMFDLATQGKTVNPSVLVMDDQELSAVLCESTLLPEVVAEQREKVVEDCVLILKKKSLVKRRHNLQLAIKKAEQSGDEQTVIALQHEFNVLLKEK